MQQPPLLVPEPPWLPELLQAIAEHELLAAHQIAALTGRPPGDVASVLERLVRDRQLRVLRGATASTAYALALRGSRLLAELTGGGGGGGGGVESPYRSRACEAARCSTTRS
jgi:hypothetical protein